MKINKYKVGITVYFLKAVARSRNRNSTKFGTKTNNYMRRNIPQKPSVPSKKMLQEHIM